MALTNADHFARHASYGRIPGDLALAVTSSAADADLLQKIVREKATPQARTMSGSLATSLNTLLGKSLSTTELHKGLSSGRVG